MAASSNNQPKKTRQFSLRLVLIVPFVVLVTGAVSLVGYLSYRSGQEAVTNLANQLMDQASNRVIDRLDTSIKSQQQSLAFTYQVFQQGNLKINDRQQLKNYLWQQMNLSSATSIFFGNEQGELIIYGRLFSQELVDEVNKITSEKIDLGEPFFGETLSSQPNQRNYYLVDDQGRAKKLVLTTTVDTRTTDWYLAAKNAQKQTWSPVYLYRVLPDLGISSVVPIYDMNQQLQGVLAIDFSLSEISTFLNKLKFSPKGQAFIMERSGDLVATSTLEIPYLEQKKGAPVRLPATQSQDPRTRAIATYLQQEYGDLSKIQASQHFQVVVDGVNIFTQVEPYQDEYGLDWLMVTAIPASDFMGEIEENTRWTFLLCGLTLLAALGMGLSTARWVTRPIERLSRSSQAITHIDWQGFTQVDIKIEDQFTQTHRIVEIETLTNSIHQMLVQLQNSHRKIAENLHQQELENQNILAMIPELIFVSSAEGIFLRQLKTNYQDELNVFPGDIVGSSLWDFLPADVVELRLHYINQALETGEIQTHEQQVEVNGFLQDEEVRTIKIGDREVLTMIRNISDRKRMEIALQTREEQFRHAFEDASIGMAIVSLDGYWLRVNAALCKIVGYSSAELLSLTFRDITYPEDLELDTNNAHNLSAGKISTYQSEKRYVHKQGQIIWILVNCSLVRDSQGNPLHFISQIQDITDRKEAQKTLELQSVIMNNMAGGVCLIKASDLMIVYTNPKYDAMFGYLEGELVGQPVGVLNYVDDRVTPEASVLDIATQLDRAMMEAKYEVQNKKKDGTPFWCRVHTSRLEHPEYGTVYVNVQGDITELKLAEENLVQAKEAAEAANQAKSIFLANMSHELRSPLNAIMGFSQLMQRTPNLPAEHYENAKIIYRSGNYLLSLINNILDLSKIEANKTTLNIQEFNLYNLLNDLKSMLQLRADSAGLALIFECSPEVPANIHTDKIKLQQILINLLGNALKFTSQGSIVLRVTCSFSETSNITLFFSIQDTGVGMTPEELPKIFEAFNQAEAGRKIHQGTGLGLTISRQFIQLLGGDISVTSELGGGTTFQFHIQAQKVPGLASTEGRLYQEILGLAPGQPQYKVLIVDDIEVNRQILVKMLSPVGFQVQEAKNGQEAIDLWKSWSPQLIFMDLRMPIMDGYTATKKIKAHSQEQNPIVIALSANVSQDEKTSVLAAGCDDFYVKPFTEQGIFNLLSQYLGVSYIYAKDPIQDSIQDSIIDIQANIEINIQANIQANAVLIALTTEDFASIPQDWPQKVYRACLIGDFDHVMQLIKEIPASTFRSSLEALADEFQAETILELIQPLIENLSNNS